MRRCNLSRCVILATRTVATGGFGKVIRASHQLLSSIAATSYTPLSSWADLLQVGTLRGLIMAGDRLWLPGAGRLSLPPDALPSTASRSPTGTLAGR